MIEERLRASFARHEPQAPEVATLRRGIDALAARRRRRRVGLLSGGVAATVSALLVAVTVVLRQFAPVGDHVLPATILPGTVPDRALNLLLLGLEPPELGLGADSITVVHVSADRQTVYLVDLSRSLLVDIPGHGEQAINEAHRLGGAGLTATVVENLTGLELDGTVTVTLDALREVTDILGPVPICVPKEIISIHTARTFPVGCYELDGAGVADLTRQRTGLPVGTYDRSDNVRAVMVGLADRASSLNLLSDVGQLAALLNVQGMTVELPDIDVVTLAGQLSGVGRSDIVGITSPTFYPAVDSPRYEALDPVVAPQLFAALREDALPDFMAAHPDWVATTS